MSENEGNVKRLEPCPFCGGNANRETGRYALRWAWCENPSCRAFARAELPIDTWNTRPLEDALRAELASVKLENARLRADNLALVEHRENPDADTEHEAYWFKKARALEAELAAATARAEKAEKSVAIHKDEIARLLKKYTVPCPSCDFGSGQRGMDTCGYCEGTGRKSLTDIIRAQRDEVKADFARKEKEFQRVTDEWGQSIKDLKEEVHLLAHYKEEVDECSEKLAAARDRVEKAEAEFDDLAASHVLLDEAMKCADSAYHEATARAERAEAERDVLAHKFAEVSDKMNGHNSPRSFCHACNICPATSDMEMEGVTCEVRLLQWAAQEAARRGGEV